MFNMRFCMAAAAIAAAAVGASALATPIPPAASDFAQMAAQSDAYEIAAGHTAMVEATDPRIRSFAEEMIKDHTRSSEALRQAAEASGMLPPAPEMGADQASLLSALQSVRGAEFDQTYIRQQVLAHVQALAVEESYARAGSDPNLRRAAQAAVPIIQHHLEMAQKLKSSGA